MSWSRCSSLVALAALLVAASATGVGAVSVVDESTPANAAVDSKVAAAVTLDELYDQYDQWSLRGSTELENATWTVVEYDAADRAIGRQSYDNASFAHPIDIGNDVVSVDVKVTGTAPAVANYSYAPPQSFTLIELQQDTGGSAEVFATYETRHHTAESAEARAAIDDAGAAVAGGSQASALLDNAISAYEIGNFENAINLAQQAEETAAANERSRDRTRLALYGVGGLVVLGGLAVVGFLWYRSRQPASRL